MKTLLQLLREIHPDYDEQAGDVGIEIEIEGENLRVPVKNSHWLIEDDGSLRGTFPETRAEYVLRKPVKFEEAEQVIDVLVNLLAESELHFSYRTSVHVHINVQQLTYDQYLSMIYTYLLLEEPLVNFCGRIRKGNRFCLRLQDAEGILETLTRLFGWRVFSGEYLPEVEVNAVRYASLNLASLRKYGSLEFRAMRGNLDKDTLLTWVNALKNIREFASKCGTPEEVYRIFAENGPVAFLNMVLQDVAASFSYPRVAKEMLQSFSLSLDLPFSYGRAKKKVEKKIKVEVPKIVDGIVGHNRRAALIHLNWDIPVWDGQGDVVNGVMQ